MQGLQEPSFLGTMTTGLDYGLVEGLIIFAFNISFICSSIMGLLEYSVLYSLCRIGGWSPVSSVISTKSVQPKSVSFSANRDFYDSNSTDNARAS